MNLIKLHHPKDKKYKSIQNREVLVNTDIIRFIRRKDSVGSDSQTEIWFDSKDCLIVTETPDEIISIIKNGFEDKINMGFIKFKDGFNEKEYEDFIKREG